MLFPFWFLSLTHSLTLCLLLHCFFNLQFRTSFSFHCFCTSGGFYKLESPQFCVFVPAFIFFSFFSSFKQTLIPFMANQPPVRPWFRLASLRSLPQAPAPASETRPPAPAPAPAPVAIPTFRTSSAPSTPQIQRTQPPPPAAEPVAPPPPRVERASAPASPVQKVSSPVQKGTISVRSPVPSDKEDKTQSPKTIKPAVEPPKMESPKVKSTSAPPPSPLVLPPPARMMKTGSETEPPAEAEQKTVLVQKSVEKPKQQRVNGEKGSIPHHEKLGGPKEGKKTEEAGMRVITIAGENRGAFMEVIQSPNKLKKKEGVESEKSSDEGDAKKKKDKSHSGKATSSFPMTAFLNSNVQCVNNSLVYHASISHHDPGVRLALSKKPFADGFHVKEQKN